MVLNPIRPVVLIGPDGPVATGWTAAPLGTSIRLDGRDYLITETWTVYGYVAECTTTGL